MPFDDRRGGLERRGERLFGPGQRLLRVGFAIGRRLVEIERVRDVRLNLVVDFDRPNRVLRELLRIGGDRGDLEPFPLRGELRPTAPRRRSAPGPVMIEIARTPGIFSAAEMSMLRIAAFGCGELRILAISICGRLMS